MKLPSLTDQQWALCGALLWLMLTLPALALVPLFDYDETIYAQTAADMLHHGQWIVPMANGMTFFEKPPFTYYMMEAGFVLFGENAFAARLPSALFTLLTAWLLFRFLAARQDARGGLLAAAVFLSMFEVGLLAHAAILDAVLNFFITGSLLAYLRWLDTASLRHACWCAAMMGMAVAIKGPVGVVVPVLIITLDRLWQGDFWGCLRRIPWHYAMPLFVLCASPWYVMIVQTQGWGFLREFIMVHNIGRAMQPMQGHGGGWHYYLVVFAVSSLPWLFWLAWLVRHGSMRAASGSGHLVRFCLLWMLAVIVLFTLAQTKLPHYISCIYPAMALALAVAWRQRQRGIPRYVIPCSAGFLLPVALLLLFFPWLYAQLPAYIHHPRALAILAQAIQPSWWIAVAGLLLLLALLSLFLLRRWHVSPIVAFVLLGLLLQTTVMWPLAFFAGQLIQGPAMAMATLIRSLPTDVQVYSYNLNAPSVSFYAQRNYQILLGEKGRKTWQARTGPSVLLMREESLPDFSGLAKQTPVFRQGGFVMFGDMQ